MLDQETSHSNMRTGSELTSSTTETDKLHPLAKEFHPSRQLRRLIVAGLSKWAVTIVICAGIYGTLIWFSTQPIFPKQQSFVYYALITALSIVLGLNIASSLKAMAQDIRWWVLSKRMWTLQEMDLILHGDSLAHLVRLGMVSSHVGIRVGVVFWLLINIVCMRQSPYLYFALRLLDPGSADCRCDAWFHLLN